MDRFRRRYGAGPLHLIAFLTSLLVSGLAVRRFFDSDGSETVQILVWFGLGIVVADLVFLPLYSFVDRVLSRRPADGPGTARFARVRAHVRVPLILSGLLLLVFAPLILRRSPGDFGDASSLSPDPFLHRWLIVTAALFALSAASYLVRVALDRRRGSGRS